MITVIYGPTASGKSALAVGRAKDDSAACIINADAMQCYDALPILTAQPTDDERAEIPHRLYSAFDANTYLTAAMWVEHAVKALDDALVAGQKPYLVGGTGLYLKALMDGLSPMPDIPDDVRASVRARLTHEGLPAIYGDLQTRDPVMASRLESGDTQRILRAVEVLDATGESLAAWQEQPLQKHRPDWRYHVITLNPPKDVLEQKIRLRLDAMMANGAMDEIRALSDRIDAGDVPADAPVIVAHGFRHFRDVLKGKKAMEDAIEETVIETRQYTKRQRTWLRNQITANEEI